VTLGAKLKQKRIENGKSLEQISALTKIHIKILNAIEEDRYSELPARAFTRGFIVNYAKALKLDPESLLSEYQEFLEARFGERQARDQGHHGYAFEGKELEQNKRGTWIALSVAAGFTLAVVLIFKPGNHKSKEKHKEYAIEEASPSAAPTASEQASPGFSPAIAALNPSPSQASTPLASIPSSTPAASIAPSATPAAEPTTAPIAAASPSPSPTADKLNKGDDLSATETKIKLVIVASEDAWTRYKTDEKPIGMLILRSGRTLVIKAKNRILFETNPAAKLQFKTRKTPMADLPSSKIEMTAEGEANSYTGSEMGRFPLSDTIPPPRGQ
jgi:cytoskeletal protein RodZ